ncbi:enhancer of mRNA-decapping protein 3 [Pieris napi]|uniref:enhancer of mRNA-decapping protein 3 n=1 Tax=Pieris napi TaxID=78633 RepID=UPI001FBBF042|nr:enhancer of mRNA-decapping protein 3 [Pieris napi]
MSKWIGCAVSVNCGEPLGYYQGTILKADANTITLTKAFRNGFPYPKSQVTLKAADIKDLKIIEEAKVEPQELSHSTVRVTKANKKGPRATVCENLQANSSNTGIQQNNNASNKTTTNRGGATPARSKPIDIQPNRNKNNTNAGSYNLSSTPKARGGGGSGGSMGGGTERARRRNEACFGDAADPAFEDDFDFEGNLALFDKQAVSWEVRSGAGGAARPDVVADAAMRHDESVLPAPPAARPALRLPAHLQASHDYTTDDGRTIPAATPRARQMLWESLLRLRLLDSALLLISRAVADFALRLCGGGRRLEARNAHQVPVVVVAAGTHLGGAAGVLTARLLLSHGVRAHVALSGEGAESCALLQRELTAFAAAGGAAAWGTGGAPVADLVVLALYDPLADAGRAGHSEVLGWVRAQRAAVLALEPPAGGWPDTPTRAAVVGGLPTPLDPSLGRVFLANIAPPQQIFKEMNIEYRPPFGAASLLPLH